MARKNAASITARQREVHRYMLAYQAEHGFPPTIRQIGDAMGIRSPNGVMCHLAALTTKGLARRARNTARGCVAIDDEADEGARCPACGRRKVEDPASTQEGDVHDGQGTAD